MDISTFGRYQVIERLGQGGMGVVYRAFDPQIERTVAIKVISAGLVNEAEHRERFFREARAAGQLSHKNIITIYDLGEENGQPYIAMEYIDGQNLETRMRQPQPLPLGRKLDIVIQVCEGLAYAHERGVIHRDMKPANVMLTAGGGVRILDFGLARLVTSELTRSNVVLGTMNYMAPEQIRAEAVDHRADIFSVGVLFYELMAGRRAFHGDSYAATMFKILQESPPPLVYVDTSLPPDVDPIVERAIAKNRDHRYQTMGEMLRDLVAARAQLPDAPVVRGPLPTGIPPWSRGASDPALDAQTMLDVRTPAPPASARPGSGSDPYRRPTTPLPTPGAVTPAPPPAVPGSGPPASSPASQPAVLWSRAVTGIGVLAMVVIAIAAVIAVFRSAQTPPAAGPEPATESQAAAPDTVEAPPGTPATAPPTSAAAPQSAAPAERAIPVEEIAKETESARKLYQAGRYEEAARAAGKVLQSSPTNREAQRLMADVSRYARQTANDALAEMVAARRVAEAARADTLAAEAFERAVAGERAARGLMAAGDYARATASIHAARGLFRAAEIEATREAETRAAAAAKDRQAALPQPQSAPPPAAPPAQTRTAEPVTPVVPLPAPPPAPAPAPERKTGPGAAAAIGDVLQQYTAALRDRSLPALKRIWPTLSGTQERAVRAEFENARSIDVRLEAPRVEVSGDRATVVARRHYALATHDGHDLRTATRTTIQLRSTPAGWVIESIRHERAQ